MSDVQKVLDKMSAAFNSEKTMNIDVLNASSIISVATALRMNIKKEDYIAEIEKMFDEQSKQMTQ
jgi:hypothetical protein